MFLHRGKRLITSIIANIGHIRFSLAFNFSHKAIDLARHNSAGASVYKTRAKQATYFKSRQRKRECISAALSKKHHKWVSHAAGMTVAEDSSQLLFIP